MCKICHLPSRDPHLTMCCGHIFCKSCLNANAILLQRGYCYNIHPVCPMCRTEEFATVSNKQVYREVRSLQIFCTNKKRGCTWQGEVSNLCNHLEYSDGCVFEKVDCFNAFEKVDCFNACGMKMQRQYLTRHIDTECP